MQDEHSLVASLTYHLGNWPETQACALTGNRTSDLSVQTGTQFTEPHQPGHLVILKMKTLPEFSFLLPFAEQ